MGGRAVGGVPSQIFQILDVSVIYMLNLKGGDFFWGAEMNFLDQTGWARGPSIIVV